MISTIVDRLGEWNPQLFRELKGRLKGRNLAIASSVSLLSQFFLYLYYSNLLPNEERIDSLATEGLAKGSGVYSRYCLGTSPEYYGTRDFTCVPDLLGHWMLNWRLWWLDIFVCISVVSIFAFLVVGTYLLIADLGKEESQGTLNFVRLSPQDATTILTGKILGVPILLYLVGILALPLHLGAGLSAGVPIGLIFAFYAVLAGSCAFFYSGALFFGLATSALKGFKPWLGSGAVLGLLFILTAFNMSGGTSGYHTTLDWVNLFYPSIPLYYAVDATNLSKLTIDYFPINYLEGVSFYGQTLFHNAAIGIGATLLHYGWWTYWLWQGLIRRFHNPITTVISKQQSYWISSSFSAIVLGFALQTGDKYYMFNNYGMLLFLQLSLFLILIAALSPHRQTLQDWSRYRHQNDRGRKNLIKELMLGDKSPSTLTIAVNLAISFIYILPSIFLFPFESYQVPVFWGIVLNSTMIMLYATIAQSMLLMKTKKRGVWAFTTVSTLIVIPTICLTLLNITGTNNPVLWLFTFVPAAATQYAMETTMMMSFIGQFAAIALMNIKMTRNLRQLGASETKVLMTAN